MHHQVQQLGNLGLERLGFDGWIGGRHVCSMHDVESVDIARWFWGSSFSFSVSVSLRFKCSAMAEQQFHAVAGAPLACRLEPTGAQQSRKHAGAILVDLVTLQFHSRVHFRPSRITKSPALDSACTWLLPPHASLLPLLCLWDGAMSSRSIARSSPYRPRTFRAWCKLAYQGAV